MVAEANVIEKRIVTSSYLAEAIVFGVIFIPLRFETLEGVLEIFALLQNTFLRLLVKDCRRLPPHL